ncbi:MAG: hypothetical protein ABUL77_02215 [Bacteroidota bacterium]
MASRLLPPLSIAVAGLVVFFFVGCSSSSGPRDKNWGSEVGRANDAGSDAVDGTTPEEEPADASQAGDALDAAGAPDAVGASDASDANQTMVVSDAAATDGASDGETMDGDALTAQYTGGSRAAEGATP